MQVALFYEIHMILSFYTYPSMTKLIASHSNSYLRSNEDFNMHMKIQLTDSFWFFNVRSYHMLVNYNLN